jgi:hypothetical protein
MFRLTMHNCCHHDREHCQEICLKPSPWLGIVPWCTGADSLRVASFHSAISVFPIILKLNHNIFSVSDYYAKDCFGVSVV